MGIPSVRQLLSQVTSYELTEWMAYEHVAGPLDNSWRDKVAAETHYLLQWNNFLLGVQCTPKDSKNPVPEPQFIARPWALDDEPEPEEEE